MAAWLCCLTPWGCKTSPWRQLLIAQDPQGRQQESALATDNPCCAWNQQSPPAGTWMRLSPFTQQPDKNEALVQQLCIPCPVQEFPSRMLMDQDFWGQSMHDQFGSWWPGALHCLCPHFNSKNKSRYFRVLEIHVNDLKASPPRPRASGQMFEGFCGQTAHTTSSYKRSRSRIGLSQCWSTFLTTEDTFYIM